MYSAERDGGNIHKDARKSCEDPCILVLITYQILAFHLSSYIIDCNYWGRAHDVAERRSIRPVAKGEVLIIH